MIVSVNVGFLYMAVLQFVWVLLMVVFFTFCCEFEFWVYRVEVLKYVLHVWVVAVVYDQYVVYVSEVFYNFVLVWYVQYVVFF
jgi:hypothetical protein